jgi:hypothetical protein
MAFVWTSVSAGKVAETTHVNEVKNNIDTLADNLSAAQYSWTEMPVSQDEEIGQPQIQELQDATDYIDTVNTCSSENAGYDSSIEVGDNSTVDAVDDASAFSGEDTSVDATQYITADADNDTGIDATQNNTILSDENTTVDNNQHGTYYSSRDVGYDSTENLTVYGSRYNNYCGNAGG